MCICLFLNQKYSFFLSTFFPFIIRWNCKLIGKKLKSYLFMINDWARVREGFPTQITNGTAARDMICDDMTRERSLLRKDFVTGTALKFNLNSRTFKSWRYIRSLDWLTLLASSFGLLSGSTLCTSNIPSPVCWVSCWWATSSSLDEYISLQERHINCDLQWRVRMWCEKWPECKNDLPQYSQMKRRFLGRPTRTLVPATEVFFRWYRTPTLLTPFSSCKINQ